jgi:hypothetical protein
MKITNMDSIEHMKTVKNILLDISENLGRLTRQGVLSFEDSMIIMKMMNDRQISWMKNRFDSVDINYFYNNRHSD